MNKIKCKLKNINNNHITFEVNNLNADVIKYLKKYKDNLVLDVKNGERRSVKISTRFHACISEIAKQTGNNRDMIYYEVLKLASEIETEGGSDYPVSYVPYRLQVVLDNGNKANIETYIAIPGRTLNTNNKQMMTAVRAVEIYAAENGVILKDE